MTDEEMFDAVYPVTWDMQVYPVPTSSRTGKLRGIIITRTPVGQNGFFESLQEHATGDGKSWKTCMQSYWNEVQETSF